jgi:CheY-like chemotaxis protein
MTSQVASGRDDEARRAFRAGFGGYAQAATTALVVEDNHGSKLALTALLERNKVTVIATDSGHGALDVLAERDDIAFVLMDVAMPIMDGYETMRAIRERPRHAALPIIAVTARDAAGERERCIEAGASEYISKPIDTEELLAAIALATETGHDEPSPDR